MRFIKGEYNMNNYSISDIFDEAYRREFSTFDNSTTHIFSFSHRRKMKKIFKLYSDNQDRPDLASIKPVKRLSLSFILVIIILALTAVSAVAVALYNGFTQNEYRDHTDLLVIDYVSGLETIEYIYELTALPEDYEIVNRYIDAAHCVTDFNNLNTEKVISIYQTVKNGYIGHYDNEISTHSTVYIGDIPAIYIDSSDENSSFGILVWDNGDYILEISGHLTKNELIDLAKLLKIKNL